MLTQLFKRLGQWSDQYLGRGNAAITVPIMDGALKPNRVLDDAAVVLELPGLDDVVSDGHTLWMSAGCVVYALAGSQPVEAQRFDHPVTALAVQSGLMAVALGGSVVQLLSLRSDGPWTLKATLSQVNGQPLHGVNALAFDSDGAVLFSDGSTLHDPDHWCHDLMRVGCSGRVGRWQPSTDSVALLASHLRYAYGVLAQGSRVLFSESWRHHVSQISQVSETSQVGRSRSLNDKPVSELSDELVGYPSRMASATGGGFWLSCFVCRTQLVEFVLREPAYRQRMLKEIDPRYWIAPALSSGHSFLEPLQGAGVKQMGVLKPWAPPRSYGLVLRMTDDGRVLESFHSQVDGRHHGITAVAEHAGDLYAVSKGSARLLRITLHAQGVPS